MNVDNRQSFIQFLSQLRIDLQRNGQEWENNTLESFLDAMVRYTEDIQGYYDNTNQNANADVPSWKLLADILKGATIYE